jgi:2-keto-4-pentenoate hydratase/2-oxohepta-3-ene-1,7-dioic acid hydratase in catechol pathway
MKLTTVEVKTLLGKEQRLCALLSPLESIITPNSDSVLFADLNALYAWYIQEMGTHPSPQDLAVCTVPSTMRGFIEAGPIALHQAQVAIDFLFERFGSKQDMAKTLPTGLNEARLIYLGSEVTLKTPLPNPPMLRDFLAFETHTKSGFERRKEPMPEAWYKIPVYYKGNPNTLIGHHETVMWPHYTRKMDYELELACIVGKRGRNIPVSDASEYIFGYSILNDFSARDIQRHEMMCRLGPAKAKDFASALGPVIVTADELDLKAGLRMQARINGETWSDGNSNTCHWSFEQMISHVSMEEDVQPGDILGSGTVGNGCGLELDKWVQPGDIVELEIDGLGVLKNTLGSPQGETHPSMPVTATYSKT